MRSLRLLLIVIAVTHVGCQRRLVATPEEARDYHQLDWSIQSEPAEAPPDRTAGEEEPW